MTVPIGPAGPVTPIVAPPHAEGCPMVETTARPSALYTFSDGVTTIDAQNTRGSTQWCAKGMAVSAGDDYSRWGAGVGLLVGQSADDGSIVPFDAAGRGIVGVRFRVEAMGRSVRLGLTEVDSPNVSSSSENFSANPFTWGGSSVKQLTPNGVYELWFEEFRQPSWTMLAESLQRPLDPSRLHSLQFTVPNRPTDTTQDYVFCVYDVEWVDACGGALVTSVLSGATTATPGPYEPPPTPTVEPGWTSEPPAFTDALTSEPPSVTASTSEGATNDGFNSGIQEVDGGNATLPIESPDASAL